MNYFVTIQSSHKLQHVYASLVEDPYIIHPCEQAQEEEPF